MHINKHITWQLVLIINGSSERDVLQDKIVHIIKRYPERGISMSMNASMRMLIYYLIYLIFV